MNLTFKTIIIAPLDWGLGHATRCIPVIRAFSQMGCYVIIAVSGDQELLLRNEFPQLQFLPLKGYNIHYTKNKKALPFVLLKQIFKIFNAIKEEHDWLDKTIDEYAIDLVISDNRFGLYTKKVPCVFITHQLQIQAPFVWLEKLIQKINYRFINRFTNCWIPDFEGKENIAGALSHPAVMPAIAVQYIGPLCRFEIKEKQELLYDYCILLSGPEPQRTLLEQKLLLQLYAIDKKILLVRGLPGNKTVVEDFKNVTVKNHLVGNDLEKALLQSEYIISRSGYTTVMEIIAIKKMSILIPTPGQTEQEYLAKKLMGQHWCYVVNQSDFSFQEIINAATNFNYELPQLPANSIINTLEKILSNINF